MKIQKTVTYKESYLPTPRCKKLRYRDATDIIEVIINEVDIKDAPIALCVHSFDESVTDYRIWDDKLWTVLLWSEKHCNKEGFVPLTELHHYIRGHYNYWRYSKEEVINSYIEDAKQYIIIDNIVYKETSEPRYVSMTFGLGHNHGGTSLMIDNSYNPNINKNSYFNALERNQAIEFTKQRAIRRGDTEYIERIGQFDNIEVLIPEAVKCKPQIEAGDGDPFLNKLYSITESSSSAVEAGFLTMCLTANKLTSNNS